MATYLVLLNFTEQGAKNLKKSTARAAAFREAAVKAGVAVEAQYWTIGSFDGALILKADQEATVLRCVTGLAAEGNVRTQTMRALDAKEFEAIAGK
jgi:uncharacterized protein with GYD domain